jgi:hypothetical protein
LLGARFVVSPCCVGKLSGSSLDNYTFNATGGNASRISYPRSKAVAALLDQVVPWRGPNSVVLGSGRATGQLRRGAHGGPPGSGAEPRPC